MLLIDSRKLSKIIRKVSRVKIYIDRERRKKMFRMSRSKKKSDCQIRIIIDLMRQKLNNFKLKLK